MVKRKKPFKLMKKPAIIFIALLTCINALKAQSDDGMLWRISGNGLKAPSYVFGTIHIYCNHEQIGKPSIKSAIDSSDMVAMELDLNDLNTLLAIYKSFSKQTGKSLKAMLKPAEYLLVDSVCMALTGSSVVDFDSKTPLTVMSFMIASEKISGCPGALPVDKTIADMAKSAGKRSYGLESYNFQDSLLNTIPDTTQLRWLVDFCKDVPKTIAEINSMIKAYDAGQASKLYDIMLETSPEMTLFSELLLVQRNINWVIFLEDNMKKNRIFMAVGAGHLGGKTGLINILRETGYTVTPIKN
jgi:uncharacterized protein YbaP (TraB family)